jgi:cytochrome c oxidase cbb3-type subunit 3
MPNFKESGKLSGTDIKKLAVYVYRFGGGQAEDQVAAPVVAPAATNATAAAPAAPAAK